MITCGVIGASGYAGAELVRILLSHPDVGEIIVASTSRSGEALESAYPNLSSGGKRAGKRAVLSALVAPELACAADVVFSSGPAGFAEEWAAKTDTGNSVFIDLSADFRFGPDEGLYAAWYGKAWAFPCLHAGSVYGLPELNRERITRARVIGNPGCYPTASTLALFPALRLGIARREGIVIDAKSGVTGAGREPSRSSHYAEAADSLTPYKVGEHRHIPEIDMVLSQMAGVGVESVFTPHLAPMGRGIVSTTYFRLASPVSAEELRSAYAAFYAQEPFVRVLPAGMAATNRNVRLSNYCDISVHLAHGGKMGIAVGCIDNMVKGAAGQAVQNMNIALGLEEGAGISMLPAAF